MNIFEIQYWLSQLGPPLSKIDGKYGPETAKAARALVERHKDRETIADADLLLAVRQVVYRVVGGLATGPIDGKMGSATKRAEQAWLRGPWRNGLTARVAGDERLPQSLQKWPSYAELEDFYGPPGSDLQTATLPYPMRLSFAANKTVTKLTMHKKVVEPMCEALREIHGIYGLGGLREIGADITGGIYAPRVMRGSTKISTHAWGIAIDIDPLRNPLREGRLTARLAKDDCKDFWAVWKKVGATSLGLARDYDWMHIQFSRL